MTETQEKKPVRYYREPCAVLLRLGLYDPCMGAAGSHP
jgi:hypothetical protein